MLGYEQIILNLYKIVAKILWNQTPQAIISRLDLKSKYHARCLDVLLTVHLSISLANNQLDEKFIYFIISLLQSSTRIEQRRAHHQVKLY